MENDLSPRMIRRYIGYLLLSVGLWSFFGAASSGTMLTGLLLSIKLTNQQIGYVMSLALLFLPMQLLGAIIQDRFFNRRRYWMVLAFSHYSCYLAIAFLVGYWFKLPGHIAIAVFMVVFALSQITAQLQGSTVLAWMGEIIPRRESNSFWSRRTGILMICTMVSGILLGFLADSLGKSRNTTYALLLGIGVAFGYLSWLMQSRVPDANAEAKSGIAVKQAILSIWKNRGYVKLTGFFTFQSFFGWLSSGFIFVYLQRDMNFSMATIQIMLAFSYISSFLSSYFFRIFGNKYGRKPLLILCSILKAGEFVLWGTLTPGNNFLDNSVGHLLHSLHPSWTLPEGFAGALPVFIVGGIVNIGLTSSQFSLITSTGETKTKSLSLAMFFSIIGFAGAISSSFSGSLYDWVGTLKFLDTIQLASFNILALVSAIGYFFSIFILRGYREDGAAPTAKVVRTLLSNNPFRAIYHAHVLSLPMSENERIHTHYHASGSLIADEIIHDLYSCSARVRDSALLNIARLEPPVDRAIETELIRLLEHGQLGMQDEAAKLLGKCGSVKALPVLSKFIDHPHPGLANNAIKAIGAIHKPEAIRDLAKLFTNDQYLYSWPFAADALSRLGEYHYAELIYQAYEAEVDPVLRNQCLVALARTFSREADPHFYQMFDSEDKIPGSQLEGMLKKICATHPELNFESLISRCDANEYAHVLCELLHIQLECHQLIKPRTQLQLSELFNCAGALKHPELLRDDPIMMKLRIQILLWRKLHYEDDNCQQRFALLTALYLMQTP